MPESGVSRAQHTHIPTDRTGITAATGPTATAAARRTGLLVTLVLGGLTALPPLSMDMYLPALPAVTDALHAPAATVQLTLTACLGGMALGQVVVGPMSDRWGRRRPLLLGMVVYVLATALCVFAPTTELLIGFRLLQGLAGAAGIVIARAVVRDMYDGVEMARFFSTLMLISGVAPVIAPLIGGQVLRFTDWRGIFAVLTVVGVLLTLVVWKWLHETLPPEERHTGGVGDALRTMRGLLGDRTFTGYMVAGSLAFAALFAYVSASPFVVQEIYGASPQTFSLLFGINSIGLITVGQINGKILVGRISLDKALGFGLGVIVLAATALLLMTSGAFGDVGLVPVATGLFVLMSAMGLAMPNTNALALMRTKHAAGSASALLGTSSFLIGAIASPLVGIAGDATAVPMAVVQLVCAVGAMACFLGLCRPWQRGGARA
ncbi:MULTISPECIES: multidrug effflux MFS transporter [Streptomyces]|jgi:DHA1 family bicyclomycin/chloramphenicol resistance-like MFS transporter|uniref:multidrug effflux MFS transporter n=1 Tax=unclassified Streptomyces TaxID=2593676 RepID=UPI0008850BE3|nr:MULTISPECIES: multidrug effflux MFS transporter [unclassified Streptomyces]MDX2727785.1 multidrug effflux MFS transporter [Streptomyces sp. PA03-2a]MDX3764248.1 multidrug effflux MFS transporter [Streptomyces sp. AK08-01B]MDX3814069.1 multidrug effflux MFS transporter [Streptomyces sp. AK08-01A]SCY88330.1 MFS transporter, DHA1 family, bicyclomycin/chloramphenicol resistance protein [Streptomyces sp. 136MFCol5.1]SFS71395.1 MFS transporter, DHA1 family, bicyclomycin/chloramphenicol resistance